MLYVHLKSLQNQWTINKILVQVGLVLCNFVVHDFAFHKLKVYTTFPIYMTIFGLM